MSHHLFLCWVAPFFTKVKISEKFFCCFNEIPPNIKNHSFLAFNYIFAIEQVCSCISNETYFFWVLNVIFIQKFMASITNSISGARIELRTCITDCFHQFHIFVSKIYDLEMYMLHAILFVTVYTGWDRVIHQPTHLSLPQSLVTALDIIFDYGNDQIDWWHHSYMLAVVNIIFDPRDDQITLQNHWSCIGCLHWWQTPDPL